jgi:hypothetical protein
MSTVEGSWFWHAYVAVIPNAVFRETGDKDQSPCASIAVIRVRQEQAAPELHGKVFGYDTLYEYAGSWDHEPSAAEREAKLPAGYRNFEIPKEFTTIKEDK